MLSFTGGLEMGSVNVMTSDNGGHSTEQIVELLMDKIMRCLIQAASHPRPSAGFSKSPACSIVSLR